MWVMVRSAKERSWFLKKSAADLAVRMTMVFVEPSFSQITGPYFCFREDNVMCGIVPRLNM